MKPVLLASAILTLIASGCSSESVTKAKAEADAAKQAQEKAEAARAKAEAELAKIKAELELAKPRNDIKAAAAKVDAARAQCQVLRNAINAYMLKSQVAPASLEDLRKNVNGRTAVLKPDAAIVDPWGNPYQFEITANGSALVFSKGPPGGPRIE